MDEQREYPFEFSVVMAVYNVEPFLREAVDSLIGQDFGFEKIQLIMVDDGSTDGSGAICDEYAAQYPKNVMVIHKENGGVASARNEGLKYAMGRYINFMDSDDKLTENVCSEVYEFFCLHENEVDVVAIPMAFFDAVHGEHWQNTKFRKGNRVIDLFRGYQATLMTMCASFITNRCKDMVCFDDRLCVGEDAKVLLKILAEKMCLGVVCHCKYLYRRRSMGEASLIQASKLKPGWYMDYMVYLIDWAIDYYQKKFGYLPAFLQYQLCCDLQWKFTDNKDMEKVLTLEEQKEFKQKLFDTLKHFDDRYIMEQAMIWEEEKCYILSKKYEAEPTITPRENDAIVHFQNTNVINLSNCYTKLEFIGVTREALYIEGYCKLIGVTQLHTVRPFILVDGEHEVFCEVYDRGDINKYCYKELIYPAKAFCCTVPLTYGQEPHSLRFGCYIGDVRVLKTNIRYGEYAPIGKNPKQGYCYKNGWAITQSGATLYITPCGRRGQLQREYHLLKGLYGLRRASSRKAVFARLAYWLLRHFIRKPIWLVSDRIMKGDDNGEALFRYLCEGPKRKQKVYFIVSKDGPDHDKLKEIGSVVDFLSWKHKMLFLLCEYNISSQADELVVNPFGAYAYYYQDLIYDKKFIFLQHGVTKDDLSGWLNRFNKNIAMFVTTTKPEYNSILEREYYYDQTVVKLTGFPRYDLLYHQEQKQITIMPSWRAYLVSGIDPATGLRSAKPGFTKSKYYKMYQELLTSSRLFDAARRLGYKVAFLAHPNMVNTTEQLVWDSRLEMLSSEKVYRDIFAQSDLVITDYSSVAFDFAYLRKPVVYYQADKDEFFSGAHTYEEGYFDYERDGFGEVEYSVEALVDRIIEYMENNCELKDMYRERIDATFPFSDQNNCQRVYEEIMKLEGEV